MQYSPKLKKAMEQIKKVLKEHDIAGMIILHTPGFSEYFQEVAPTYSCARMEPAGIRITAKSADFPGGATERNQKLVDTSNMLHHLAIESGKQSLAFIEMSEHLDRLTQAEHGKGKSTSHESQNN